METTITEEVHVIQLTEHQIAFSINGLFFVDIPSEFLLEEIQQHPEDITIEIIREERIFTSGLFIFSEKMFFLPKIIPLYLKRKYTLGNKIPFLTCYMFKADDRIILNNLHAPFGDTITSYNPGIMDQFGQSEDLHDYMNDD